MYRALNHGDCARAHGDLEMTELDRGIWNLVKTCAYLKTLRLAADYDPGARFTKSQVSREMARAGAAMDRFEDAEMEDQRALATILLFRRRRA